MKKMTKSPLKANPLRNPGQSLDERIQDVIYDEIFEKAIYLIVIFVLALLEWYRYYMEVKPNPYIMTIAFIILCFYAFPKIIKGRRKLNSLKLGRDGEKAVGQYLDSLRLNGFEVLHDIVGGQFNIDHIIVSEHGVYTIETKTYSKPGKGEAKIAYRDGKIFKNNVNIGDGIVIQAKAQAKWLKELIKDTLGRDYVVQPIVVFPGWYVDVDNKLLENLWLLNPKGIGSFINNKPKVLSTDDKKAVAYNLSRFVRNS